MNTNNSIEPLIKKKITEASSVALSEEFNPFLAKLLISFQKLLGRSEIGNVTYEFNSGNDVRVHRLSLK